MRPSRTALALFSTIVAACSTSESGSTSPDGKAPDAGRAAGGVSAGGRSGGGTGGLIDGSGGIRSAGASAGFDGGRTGGAPSGSGGALSGAGGASSGGAPGDGSVSTPGQLLGAFVLTYYWVTTEGEFSGAKDATLYDDTCASLAVVTSGFADSLDIEGTGRLADGRLLNVSGTCACPRSPCYAEADAQHPWGYGARSNALVPFRSVAVDRTVVPLGSHLYVAELDGVTMPGDPSYGQFVHDGCVSADDVGGGIVGQHIDFFAALRANYVTLDRQLGLNSVTVRQGGSRCP